MTRKIVVAAAAGVLVAGGAYYGLFVLPDNQFRAGLDQALAALPQGYTGHYGSAHYSLLAHVATVTDLSIQGSGLAKATLRYQDASLINRLLVAGADERPKPADLRQMREAYAANLLATLGPLASDPKLADSVKAIAEFAKMPRNLTIALAPPAPVPLFALKEVAAQGPKALVDMLGLSITASQQSP